MTGREQSFGMVRNYGKWRMSALWDWKSRTEVFPPRGEKKATTGEGKEMALFLAFQNVPVELVSIFPHSASALQVCRIVLSQGREGSEGSLIIQSILHGARFYVTSYLALNEWQSLVPGTASRKGKGMAWH